MDNQEVSQPPRAGARFFYGYIIVAIFFIIQVIMFGQRSSYGVFFIPLLTEFGWTRALVSGAYSLSMFLQGCAAIIMGILNDRLGPRVAMMVSGFLLGLGLLMMSLIGAAWQLYLFYVVIIGTGMGGLFAPPASTLARWFVKRRGTITGIAMAGGSTGMLIVPPVVNVLISAYDWRHTFIITGIFTLVAMILLSQFLRRDPAKMGLVPYGENKGEEQPVDLGTMGFSHREALYTRQFWMATAMLFCFGFCIATIMVHTVPHATDMGISAATAASFLSVMGGGLIIGNVVLGTMADRTGSRQAYIISFFLMAVALAWLLPAREAWQLYLFAAVFGLGIGGAAVLSSPLTAELFGMKSHGVILGLINFTSTLGAAVGPLLAGYLFDSTGSYNIAFLLCLALAVAGTILAATLKPTRKLSAQKSSLLP